MTIVSFLLDDLFEHKDWFLTIKHASRSFYQSYISKKKMIKVNNKKYAAEAFHWSIIHNKRDGNSLQFPQLGNK